MRRFVTLALFVLFAIPFGVSINGCAKKTVAPTYCNGQTSGVQVGQLASLDLEPRLTGISLNEGEIGRVNSPSGKDCRGNSASAAGTTYASTNIYLADVQPSTGALCAGSWNRNTGGAIPDFTVCTPSATSGVAYLTASAEGVVSNPIPVFIHPIVTSIVLGTASSNCTSDAASNCVDLAQLSGFDSGNPGTLSISQTVLSGGGVATYTYTQVGNETPAPGQRVTITGTKNGSGLLNATNATIATVTAGTPSTFTVIGFPINSPLSATAESGQAIISLVAYNGNSCLSQGQTAQLVARTYATVAPVVTIPITGYSITNNVATFQTSAQSLSAGQVVNLARFSTGSYFNAQPVTVLATGLSGSSFQAVFTHLNVGLTADSGTATYNGTPVPNTNISASVGPLQFSSLNASVVTIDANGVATAAQPGSASITAAISQASSTAGFFSTCPPASIVLSIPPSTTAPTSAISVNQNTTQPFLATVTDIAGNPITNLSLTYVSTSPTTIPASGADTTPVYPGAAAITALCQPPNCNPSPYNEIGLFGNGTPITSNPVQVQSTGTNFSTVLYIASKESQFLLPYDFTTSNQVSPVRLPYAPNSMAISTDNSTIYMGTTTEIMVFSTASNSLIRQDNSVSGNVIAVSPDSTTVIVTDPVRQLTYLYLSSGGVSTEYGGVATRASFSADSSTVYITTTDGRLLVHSTFTGWSSIPLANVATDAAVTIPAAGVYLGGSPVDVHTNCPATTFASPVTGSPTAATYNPAGFAETVTNSFYPDAGVIGVTATRLAATNDGLHILGATNTSFTDILTNAKTGGCPYTFTSTVKAGTPLPLALGAGTGISNVLVTSDSAFAFVTYQGTAGTVPQYSPATGVVTPVALNKLVGTPLDAVSGTVSADNNTLFIGSEGDNAVHLLTRGTTGFTDTKTPIVPALPNINGSGTAQPDLLVQHPRKSTS